MKVYFSRKGEKIDFSFKDCTKQEDQALMKALEFSKSLENGMLDFSYTHAYLKKSDHYSVLFRGMPLLKFIGYFRILPEYLKMALLTKMKVVEITLFKD